MKKARFGDNDRVQTREVTSSEPVVEDNGL